jgi:hypothetical protein
MLATCDGACLRQQESDDSGDEEQTPAAEDETQYENEEYAAIMATRFLWSDGEKRMLLPDTRCPQGCRPVPCRNAAVCGSFENARWYLGCHGGLCWECNMLVGGLCIGDVRVDCPVCLGRKCVAVTLDCGHRVCAECFVPLMKRAAFGDAPGGGGRQLRCPLCRAAATHTAWRRP